jgi:hypothetical protein
MPQIARCLLPTNKRLLDENVPPKPDEAESLLQHGGNLHWVRSILETFSPRSRAALTSSHGGSLAPIGHL